MKITDMGKFVDAACEEKLTGNAIDEATSMAG